MAKPPLSSKQGGEKLAASKNARQSADPSGNPGWIPAGDGAADPALCEGGKTCRE